MPFKTYTIINTCDLKTYSQRAKFQELETNIGKDRTHASLAYEIRDDGKLIEHCTSNGPLDDI